MSESELVSGTVKWYNKDKGFGFVTLPSGTDAFVHSSQLKKSGLADLDTGQKVQFKLGTGAKGSFATDISIVQEGSA